MAILRSYVVNYGPFETDRVKYWPVAAQVIQQLGWTVDRLNAWLGVATAASEPAIDHRPALETAQ